MSLSVNDLMNYAGTGKIVIAGDANAGAPAIKQAGFIHKIKEFFGFKSAKATNEATLNAIRTAIQNDAKYISAYDTAEKMLNGVKGTITVETIKSMFQSLDSKIDNASKADREKAIEVATKGRLALKGTPKFISSLPWKIQEDFTAFYTSTIAKTIARSEGGMNLEKCVKIFDTMFDNVRDMYENNENEAMADAAAEVTKRNFADLAKMLMARNVPFLDENGCLPSEEDAAQFANKVRGMSLMATQFAEVQYNDKAERRDMHDAIMGAVAGSKVLVSVSDITKMTGISLKVNTSVISDLRSNHLYDRLSEDEIVKALKDFDKLVADKIKENDPEFDRQEPSVQRAKKNIVMAASVARLPKEMKISLKMIFLDIERKTITGNPDIVDMLRGMNVVLDGVMDLFDER